MLRREFLAVSSATALVSCAPAPGDLVLAPKSTLIVTRHGDRDGDDLSDKGRQRARDLVDAVAAFDIAGIYSPGIQRNLDTAAPLAEARGLPITRRPQEAPTAALVDEGAGKTLIWIGNSGNITRIWEDLRLSGPAPVEYGDLFIIRSDATGAARVERRRYGPE